MAYDARSFAVQQWRKATMLTFEAPEAEVAFSDCEVPCRILRFGPTRVLVLTAQVAGNACRLELREGQVQHFGLVVPVATTSKSSLEVCNLLARARAEPLTSSSDDRSQSRVPLRIVLGPPELYDDADNEKEPSRVYEDRVLAHARNVLRKANYSFRDDSDDSDSDGERASRRERRQKARRRWRLLFRRLGRAIRRLRNMVRPWLHRRRIGTSKHLRQQQKLRQHLEAWTMKKISPPRDSITSDEVHHRSVEDMTPKTTTTTTNNKDFRGSAPSEKETTTSQELFYKRVLMTLNLPGALRDAADMEIIEKLLSRSSSVALRSFVTACSKSDAHKFFSSVDVLHLPPKTLIAEKETALKYAYLVVRGRVDFFVDEDSDVVSASAEAGAAFGEIVVTSPEHHEAHLDFVARAKGPVTLARFPRSVAVSRKKIDRETECIAAALRKLGVFKSHEEDTTPEVNAAARRLHGLCEKRSFRVDTLVAKQDTPLQHVFFLMSGECRILRTVHANQLLHLECKPGLYGGECFGPTSEKKNTNATFSLVAGTFIEALVIDATHLKQHEADLFQAIVDANAQRFAHLVMANDSRLLAQVRASQVWTKTRRSIVTDIQSRHQPMRPRKPIDTNYISRTRPVEHLLHK